jgi:hypothetical protein
MAGLRLNLPPFPPYPPAEWPSAGGEQRGRKGGPAIGFHNAGTWRHLEKPVDQGVFHHHFPRGTKASARFARFENPRIGLFCPRIRAFFPQVGFSVYGLLSLSFFLFLEERERKNRRGGAKAQSTTRKGCQKMHPRIFLGIRVNPWMAVDAKPSIHAGCSGVGGAIHDPRPEMPVCLRQGLPGGLGYD